MEPTTKRFHGTLGPLGALVLCLPLWLACQVGTASPGDDDDDEVAGGPDAGGGAVALCTPSDVASTVFATKCAGGACHDADQPAAGLDLQSPGIAARTMGISSSCGGEVLVVAGDPGSSYLVQKLGVAPTCGDPMPKGGVPLSDEEIDCVSGWVSALNADTGGTGGGGGGGGGY